MNKISKEEINKILKDDYKYLDSFKDKREEYEFYENALQAYGKFDMRYNQMVAEVEEERKNENEKKKILDLIYSYQS